MFTEIDHQKFRNLRITHVATRFEELISDEANDELTPEQIFLTAVDDALDQRQAHRIDKLIRAAKFPIPQASIAEINYQEGRGITPVRMKRYAGHHWRQDPTNLLVISPTGGGKTYLACAIGIAAWNFAIAMSASCAGVYLSAPTLIVASHMISAMSV